MDEFAPMWAILPGPVRYDPKLPANAKLLYSEIAAKTNTTGYCWASNEWFSQKLGLSADSISRLIKTLQQADYIGVTVDPRAVNAERRIIFLTPKGLCPAGGIGKNADTQSRQKRRDRIGKNAEAHIIENNKIQENKPLAERPKYLALDVFDALTSYAGENGQLLLALLGWVEMRHRIRKPVATAETVRRACRTLDKLAEGDLAYKLGCIRKSTDHNWLGFFALKEGDEGYHAPLQQQAQQAYDALGGLPLL